MKTQNLKKLMESRIKHYKKLKIFQSNLDSTSRSIPLIEKDIYQCIKAASIREAEQLVKLLCEYKYETTRSNEAFYSLLSWRVIHFFTTSRENNRNILSEWLNYFQDDSNTLNKTFSGLKTRAFLLSQNGLPQEAKHYYSLANYEQNKKNTTTLDTTVYR